MQQDRNLKYILRAISATLVLRGDANTCLPQRTREKEVTQRKKISIYLARDLSPVLN